MLKALSLGRIYRRSKGFTLIELLVVIAIIGILSSITLATIQSARVKGRDTERINELREIRNALELYYTDKGYYPPSGCGWDCNGYFYSYNSSWNTFKTELAPYIGDLPIDPVNSACAPWNNNCYSYAYGNVGRNVYHATYDLTAQFENQSSRYRCGVKNYRFYFDDRAWCTAFGGGYSNYLYEASIDI